MLPVWPEQMLAEPADAGWNFRNGMMEDIPDAGLMGVELHGLPVVTKHLAAPMLCVLEFISVVPICNIQYHARSTRMDSVIL